MLIRNRVGTKFSEIQKRHFQCKIALRLKKVCYKVSLCENCRQQTWNAFNGLSIHAKMIGGGCPLKCTFCIKWTSPWHGNRAD